MDRSTTNAPKPQQASRQTPAPATTLDRNGLPDAASLILELQHTIGNRAVQRMLHGQKAQSPDHGKAVAPQGVSLDEMQQIASSQPGYAVFGTPQAQTMDEVREKHGGHHMAPGAWVLGFTTIPKNYIVPSFSLDILGGGTPYKHWYGKVTPFLRADSGDTDVYYVKAGKYDTGKFTRGMPIRAVVSDEMAMSARAAEIEHNMDYLFAYNITLKAADDAIQHFAGGQFNTDYPEGGMMGKSVAQKDIEEAVTKAFINRIPRLGADSSKWGGLYANRFQRTGRRDDLAWHTHGDGGLQPSDGSEMIYHVNKGKTKIDVGNPGSNSKEVVDWDSSL